MKEEINYQERRDIFVSKHAKGTLLCEEIPYIAAGLYADQFGIDNLNAPGLHTVPITFVLTWEKIAEFLHDQPTKEFAVTVAGLRVAYDTTYSSGDKPANIDPILSHVSEPCFNKVHETKVPGSQYMQQLQQKFNAWRSVNILETIDKIENEVHKTLIDYFAIDLMTPYAIFPIIAATYAAGLQIAKQNPEETINMYNVFNIIYAEGKYHVEPLAVLKQVVKGDGKNSYGIE